MYKVLLVDNETDEERLVEFDLPWHEYSLYLWRFGNFSCDCNRVEFFYEVEDDFIRCGQTKIRAIHAELEGGEIVEIDRK